MSANKPRKAGQPAYQKPKLRLVPSPEEPKRPAPDPELKEILDRVRRHPAHGRLRPGDDDKDAA